MKQIALLSFLLSSMAFATSGYSCLSLGFLEDGAETDEKLMVFGIVSSAGSYVNRVFVDGQEIEFKNSNSYFADGELLADIKDKDLNHTLIKIKARLAPDATEALVGGGFAEFTGHGALKQEKTSVPLVCYATQ